MKKVYDDNEFGEAQLRCSRCGWQGSGSETNIVDFYGVTEVQEAHCPNCDEVVANVKRADNAEGGSGDQTSFQIG